jgi:hypothetical protein
LVWFSALPGCGIEWAPFDGSVDSKGQWWIPLRTGFRRLSYGCWIFHVACSEMGQSRREAQSESMKNCIFLTHSSVLRRHYKPSAAFGLSLRSAGAFRIRSPCCYIDVTETQQFALHSLQLDCEGGYLGSHNPQQQIQGPGSH